MKSKKLWMLAMISLLTMLSAFRTPAGGEGFEIYVDNKLVVQKFHHEMKKPTNLSLTAAQAKSYLNVKFYHCGMAGKNRILLLQDANRKMLKQWQFSNTDAKNFSISIPVNEILDLHKKSGTGTVYLFYLSKETSQARLLTGIINKSKKSVTAK